MNDTARQMILAMTLAALATVFVTDVPLEIGGVASAETRGLGERLNAIRADIRADASETKRAEDSIALFAVAMDLYDSGDVGATTALLIATNEYARVMQDAAQPVSPGSPPIYSVGDCVYFLSCYGKRVMGDTEDCVVCCVDSCMSVPDPSDRADCIRDCVIRCTQPLTLPPLARDYCDGID
ncbi:MAG: hypothetical protein KDA25_07410 [Phycisphaerales bacterium]|nr:hypothetical protein [Phycisphaerales bacterium]